CRNAEGIAKRWRRRAQVAIYALLVGIIAGLIGWVNQEYIRGEWRWYTVMRPYMGSQVRPYVLSPAVGQTLKAGDSFKECSSDCPEMIVVPAGSFTMGSPATEDGHKPPEEPQHNVTIARPLAISKFELTFSEWDNCVRFGDCDPRISDSGFGRGRQPVINVTWHDAQRYVSWLSRMTGKAYRLLSEAEYEYAARAGTQTVYPWGDQIGKGNADCYGCGSKWDYVQPAPVGSFAPNAFGLYDMVGNLYEWLEDCDHA